MPTITIADSAGFCFGVDRAVRLCYAALEEHPRTATLGPIIHNQDVVDDLVRRGVRIIESIDELEPGECVVLRSHGVERGVFEALHKKGNPYVDAACPFVSKIHRIVERHAAQGDTILIAGDKNHPEIQAIVSYCGEHYFIFESAEDLKLIFKENTEILQKNLAIVAQTTYNIIEWEKCLDVLPKKPNIMVYDTICHATQVRQTDADKLSHRSDLMIIVGGRHSSNTVKLYHVCNRNCTSYHIENADELTTLSLGHPERIGITAGASTPAHIIKEVWQKMSEIMENNATVEEDINFEEALEQSVKKIHTGEKVKGIVVSLNDSEAIVDIGTKQTGYVLLSDLTDDNSLSPKDILSEGEEVDLIVTKINDQEGIVYLSKRKVDEMKGFEEIIKAAEANAILEGTVNAAVKGGVIITYAGVRVFIPASQSGLPRGAEMDEIVHTTQRFTILEVNEQRRRAVGSIRAVQRLEREAAKNAFWENAEIGKVYKGEVKSLTSYGAFVDLGGIDGMVHISELSWKRIKHPSEVVKVGDFIEVYIKDLDREKNRISLGYKKTEDNPWEKFKAEYSIGDIVDATIVSITPFGAFAQIIEGVDGLVHISQLADRRVENVRDVVSIGDRVKVKILDIDFDNKRISISMRAAESDYDGDYED